MRPDHKTYIGGSDAGPLMGVGYKSPLDVFYLKTGQREPDDLSDNEAVRWGTALEPFVLTEAERLLGLPVVSHPFKRIQNRLHKSWKADGFVAPWRWADLARRRKAHE